MEKDIIARLLTILTLLKLFIEKDTDKQLLIKTLDGCIEIAKRTIGEINAES